VETTDLKQKKCVLYCRVSTKEQADEGNSLVTQERSGNEWARKNGYTIVRTFIERGESAKTADRPELQEMLKFCSGSKKNEVQSVVVYKIDRLARNTDDYREIRLLLRRYSVEIKSITEYFEDTPAGRFMENIIANVAQFDNDVRTERCVGGMREAIREGRYVWAGPTGYSNVRINGKATIAPNEMAPLVREAFERVAKGTEPVIKIFHALKDMGLRSNKGSTISKSNFHALLRNPIYVGRIVKFGEVHQGKYEAIVSELLFDQTQTVLNGRSTTGKKYRYEHPDFPLRRFVVDSEGRRLTGSFSRGRSSLYPFYRFTASGTNMRKAYLERLVADEMNKLGFDMKSLRRMRQMVEANFGGSVKEREKAHQLRQAQLARLKGQESELVRKNLEGLIGDELLKRELERIDRAMYEVRKDLLNTRDGSVDPVEVIDNAREYLMSPGDFWISTEPETKVSLQRFQFPQGMMFDGEKFGTKEVAFIFNEKEKILSLKSCYVDSTGLTWNRFLQDCERLMEILKGRKNSK
jgi:site-specific DNA recombinase